MSKAVAEANHAMAMDAVGLAAQLLTTQADTLAALIKAERDMHNFMHITDPTFYKQAMSSKSLALQVRMARAALAFINEIQGVKNELSEAAE